MRAVRSSSHPGCCPSTASLCAVIQAQATKSEGLHSNVLNEMMMISHEIARTVLGQPTIVTHNSDLWSAAFCSRLSPVQTRTSLLKPNSYLKSFFASLARCIFRPKWTSPGHKSPALPSINTTANYCFVYVFVCCWEFVTRDMEHIGVAYNMIGALDDGHVGRNVMM
jgi:hypothetical protein